MDSSLSILIVSILFRFLPLLIYELILVSPCFNQLAVVLLHLEDVFVFGFENKFFEFACLIRELLGSVLVGEFKLIVIVALSLLFDVRNI
jgi:hypothetical protein